MHYQAIEGIDYIFNRYAYLSIPLDSTEELIKKAIRQKRAENHPDRLIHVGQDILALAQQHNDLISLCEKVLFNSDLKSLYDQKLQHFIQETPYLVSDTGTPIIDPTRFRVDIHYLLQNDSIDINHIITQAQQMSGYSEKKIEKAKQRYENNPDDIDLKNDYYEVLTNKFVYLNVLEDYYWQKAGVYGTYDKNEAVRHQSVNDYDTLLENKINKVKENVSQLIHEHSDSVLLGFSQPLLLSYQGNKDNINSTESSENAMILLDTIDKNFTYKLDEVKKLIEEKKSVVQELCLLTKYKQLYKTDQTIHDFFLVQIDENETIHPLNFGIRADFENQTVEHLSIMPEFNQDSLMKWEYSVYIVSPNKELGSPLLEIMSLVNKMIDKYQEQNKLKSSVKPD